MVLVETGVQRAEYQRKSDMDRALLQAQLNQAGFTQAQQLANQAYNQQTGLASLQPTLAASSIGMAQGLGQSDLALQTSCSRSSKHKQTEWLHLNQLKDLQDLVKD